MQDVDDLIHEENRDGFVLAALFGLFNTLKNKRSADSGAHNSSIDSTKADHSINIFEKVHVKNMLLGGNVAPPATTGNDSICNKFLRQTS